MIDKEKLRILVDLDIKSFRKSLDTPEADAADDETMLTAMHKCRVNWRASAIQPLFPINQYPLLSFRHRRASIRWLRLHGYQVTINPSGLYHIGSNRHD